MILALAARSPGGSAALPEGSSVHLNVDVGDFVRSMDVGHLDIAPDLNDSIRNPVAASMVGACPDPAQTVCLVLLPFATKAIVRCGFTAAET
jgi:hypothetical protein